MSEPTEEPVVLTAPASDASGDPDTPPGQIEHPAVPTPADAIDHDQPEGATPAVAEQPDDAKAQPGYPSMLLPPGAYIVTD